MNKISSFLNFIICGMVICIFAYLTFLSITKRQILSILIALFCFLLFSLLFFYVKNRKANKKSKTKEQLVNLQKLKIWLLTSDQNAVWQLLKEHFDLEGELLADNTARNSRVINSLCFFGESISQTEFYSVLQKGYKYNNFFCITVDSEILTKSAELNSKVINFYDLNAIFDKLSAVNSLPNLSEFGVPKKRSFKEVISVAFQKQKLLGYALLSLSLLFLSFFTPYKVYYRIVALIILALFVAIFFVKEAKN